MPSRALILSSLTLAQVWLSTSHFVFELEVDLGSVTAGNFNCDSGAFDNSECRIYFSVFCLRGGSGDSQSTNEEYCPLGRSKLRMNVYEPNDPNGNTRSLTSQSSWPVRVLMHMIATLLMLME